MDKLKVLMADSPNSMMLQFNEWSQRDKPVVRAYKPIVLTDVRKNPVHYLYVIYRDKE